MAHAHFVYGDDYLGTLLSIVRCERPGMVGPG